MRSDLVRWCGRLPWNVRQGGYYLLTGLWPLVHLRSFAAVTGPKPDRFQTQVTAALFTSVGACLVAGDPARRETRLLGAAVPIAAMCLEWGYRRQVRRVFLLEGAVELAFLGAVAWAVLAGRRPRQPAPVSPGAAAPPSSRRKWAKAAHRE